MSVSNINLNNIINKEQSDVWDEVEYLNIIINIYIYRVYFFSSIREIIVYI